VTPDELERRLTAVEDELAVLRLVASYGPAVDTGSATRTAALWAEDGTYEVAGMRAFEGSETVGALVEIDEHQGYLRRGCAHVLSLPLVRLDGDRATAVNYSRLYLHEDDHWVVARVSANHWDLVKEPGGWRVLSRRNQVLDGAAEARALLEG
jgi:hypothetical protein